MEYTTIRLKRDTYEYIRKHVDLDHSFDDVVRGAFKLHLGARNDLTNEILEASLLVAA